MTSATERTIFEQFDFLREADAGSRRPSAAKLVFVGCGSSYNLAMSLSAAANAQGFTAIAVPGHEWLRRPTSYIPNPTTAEVVAISRSGESTETVEAAKSSRAAGVHVTAITCEPHSSLARTATTVLAASTHPEEGIVMTTSASLMLLLGLQFLGLQVPAQAISEAEKLLLALDEAGSRFFEDRSHFVYLGGGSLYGVAAEGALKLQEMSCTVTQAYHPLEYRHGPVSVLDDRSIVVLLYSAEARAEEARLAGELSAKGAFVLGMGGPGDLEFSVEAATDLRGLIYMPSLQLLGERLAMLCKLDTGAPRHLTKVVRIA
jgi:glucosamine--fructose-6-phosphate aminotransferase (isomerizing)